MQDGRYTLEGVVRLPLKDRHGSARAWATVDLADGALVCARSWHMAPAGYVVSHVPGCIPKRKELLHRFLLGLWPGDGKHVDHRDRNRLNNRRSNLRVVTQAENNQNTSGWSTGTSRYRGVQRVRSGRWVAAVTINYKAHHLGTFDSELDAARAAAAFRRQHMPMSHEESLA